MTTPNAATERQALALLETVELLRLDGESCLLPTTQRHVLICEPYARLIFKSGADLRAAGPAVDTKPPAIAFAPTACARPVRFDLPLFPLLNRLGSRRLTSIVLDVTVELPGAPIGNDWCEWIAILRQAPDGGQAFLRKLSVPEPTPGPAGAEVTVRATLSAGDLSMPGLSFAIQWPPGAPAVKIAGASARIVEAWFGDGDPASRSAAPPSAVTVYFSLGATEGRRMSLPLAPGETRLRVEPGSSAIESECFALVHTGSAIVRARRLRSGDLASFLDDLSRPSGADPMDAGAALGASSEALAGNRYLEALVHLDRIRSTTLGRSPHAAGQRMAALMALRRFEEAIAAYEEAPAAFRAQTQAQVRYLEACASTSRDDEMRRLLVAALGDAGPRALDRLAQMYRYAPLLPVDDRRRMTARIATSAESVDRLRVLVRVAHDLTADGDIDAARRVLEVLAAKSSEAEDRAALSMAQAQIAFTERRYRDQAMAFNDALALWGRSPVGLLDDTAPLAADNVRADGVAAIFDGPLVSVIMTCFNSEGSLDYSVPSVLRQTYRNVELIVVDDASSDDSMARLADIARADPRLRLEHLPANAGTYVAKNTGITLARGAFVTCQDADDWAHPEKIAAMVGALVESERLIATGVQHVRASRSRGLQCRGNNYIRPDASSLMFRRGPVLDRIGYFDSVRSAADSEFARRLERSFGRDSVAYREEPLSLVHWSPATLSGSGAFAIDDDTGIVTPLRNAYRAAYAVWHEQAQSLRIDFPLETRPFPVPAQMLPRKGGVTP